MQHAAHPGGNRKRAAITGITYSSHFCTSEKHFKRRSGFSRYNLELTYRVGGRRLFRAFFRLNPVVFPAFSGPRICQCRHVLRHIWPNYATRMQHAPPVYMAVIGIIPSFPKSGNINPALFHGAHPPGRAEDPRISTEVFHALARHPGSGPEDGIRLIKSVFLAVCGQIVIF